MADNRLEIKIVADNRQAVAAVGEQARAMGLMAQKVEVAQIGFRKLAVAVAAGQAALGVISEAIKGVFIDLPRALLDGALAAEKMQKAFSALEGSLEGARSQIAFVREEANRLGIPLAEASDAWLKLAAAARGTALEGESARRIFSAVAGAASTLGLSAAETSGALLAISQMMSKGTVQAEELRGQLGERIPGAFQIAARAMGVSTKALSDMLDRGELLASDFLPKFAEQLAKELPASADGTQNAINRLNNVTEEWRRLTGSALAVALDGFFGLKQAAGELGRDNQITEWARKSAKAVALLIDVMRELALFVPNVLSTIGGAIAAVTRDIKLAFDIAAAAVTEGIGEKGRAAMKRALDERNAFIAAFNEDMAQLWFPKQLATRVDEFFGDLAKRSADASAKASAFVEAELTKDQQKTIDAIRSNEEKLKAEYKAHANNLYAALTSGAISIEEYNEQRAKLEKWYAEQLAKLKKEKGASGARLAAAKDAVEAELAILKDGLARAKAAYDAALEDRLISIRGYYAAKTAIEQAVIDADIRRQRDLLAAQQSVARDPRATEEDRIRARGEVARLEAELIVLNNRRADVEQANARAAAKAERELADALEDARLKVAQITGTETEADRRAAIERSYRDLKARLAAEGQDTGIIDRLIDVKAADANLRALEMKWRETLDAMRQAQDNANVLRDAGLLTQAQAEDRITQAAAEAKRAMEDLLPAIQAAMEQMFQPEEVARRMENLRAEILKTQPIVESLGTKIAGQIRDAFSQTFGDIVTGTKKVSDAFRSMATSILQSMARIFAQRAAEGLMRMIPLPFASGGVFESRSLAAYVNRIVSAPTLFAFASGGVPRLGLMGEAGPEAIMPLKRGADGRLGVEASGAGGVVVNVSVDATGSRVEGDAGAARQLGDMIAIAVRGILVAEKRPGGLLAGA